MIALFIWQVSSHCISIYQCWFEVVSFAGYYETLIPSPSINTFPLILLWREALPWTSMPANWPVSKKSSRFFNFFSLVEQYLRGSSFFKDSGTLLYPSVTFCPKYTWKTFPGVNFLYRSKSWKFVCNIGISFKTHLWRWWKWLTRMSLWTLKPWRNMPGWIIGRWKR